ncbi:23S rRNA (adenine(1618)-N(6))-methyltransferase RlmF [Aquimarina sediminis]|uniref:23S rRNA (adenine(1618)-N(6))-methyltransferase RlmF n=1 Tax=Aquimarina sediminis TaxID=2070536 RepID=UPI000CA08144|nr:23S rRNA (adenine(1618)-N(6))-methyltransferase RlmF [Aquimarina sediminis]
MHPKNIHNKPYNFEALCTTHPELTKHVFVNSYGTKSINFADNTAIVQLNKAILKHHYHIVDWNIPENYLCPPIPGRADYIHHIADLLNNDNLQTNIIGLDIGVGANCIYPILGAQIYDWQMVGTDINATSVASAKTNVKASPTLQNKIEIRHQKDNAQIFDGIIAPTEYYHFTMCNPPFHSSKEMATKGTLRKLRNLEVSKSLELNFGGQANELWCNGGEALFIKRMIKQSIAFKTQVGWFTSLVSKKENLPKIYKQLNKLKATHKTIEMTQGNKKSRFIAWKF